MRPGWRGADRRKPGALSAQDAAAAAAGRAYDAASAEYAALFPDLSFEAASDVAWLRRWAHETAARQRMDPALLTLDAGCGTGRLLPALGAWGLGSVVGVDPSAGMLEQARLAHPQAAWVEGSLGSLPVPDGSCAGVLAWYSVIHLSDEAAAAAAGEVARVLADGGWALWGFHSGEADAASRQVGPDGTHLTLRGWSVAAVADLLQAAGLRLVASGRRPAREGEKAAQGVVLVRKHGLVG